MDVKQYFREMSTEALLKSKEVYEKLLAEAKGDVKCNYPMPWMIPSWEAGLKAINEVINEREADEQEVI